MLQIAKRLTILLALFLALMPALVFGQASFEAQVRGVVHDATGSVIIGAKVTITDVATNISSTATTDGRGYYIFNGLHPGTYNLKAEMAGFRAEEMQNVVLAVSQRTNIDLTLNVAGLDRWLGHWNHGCRPIHPGHAALRPQLFRVGLPVRRHHGIGRQRHARQLPVGN